jgi:uncharacterized membrane protein
MTTDNQKTEPVWTFRGYELRPGEFNTAMVHFYRAEVQRANVWRQRLDTTTNWAVISTGAAISIAYGGGSIANVDVIPLTLLLVTIFLSIEARRYRYYELWASRIRLMETDFFAAMLVPPFHPSPDWAENLAESLLQPQFPISMLEAIGRRLRRNYLWIYGVLVLAWFARLWLVPATAASWAEVVSRAAIGPIPGSAALGLGIALVILLTIVAGLTTWLHAATGEVLPRYLMNGDDKATSTHRRAWFRPSRQRQQLMALIITDHGQAISDRVMRDMRRGVTGLSGQGMFTGKAHTVLVCALTITEINQLKSLVNEVDPNAFVVISPALEILGRGFAPLADD